MRQKVYNDNISVSEDNNVVIYKTVIYNKSGKSIQLFTIDTIHILVQS